MTGEQEPAPPGSADGRTLLLDAADAPAEAAVPGPARARLVGRFVALLALLLVLLQLAFFGLLVVAQAVPDDAIVDHLAQDIDDDLYGPTGRPDQMGGIAATHSECVIVGTGLGRPDVSAFERAVRLPRISSCANGDEDIAALRAGRDVDTVTDYFRYWGGYTILTRPVLALWGMGALRMLCGALFAIAAAVGAVTVARSTGAPYVAALALPLVLASNVLTTPSSALGFALSYAAVFFSVTLTALGARRSVGHAVLGTVVGAAIFNYVTQLTTPAVPWMWTAAVAGAVVFSRRGLWAPTMRAVLATGVAWPVAFTLTWASRWLIAALFVGWDEASAGVRDKIEFRLSGTSRSVDLDFGASTEVNVRFWLDAYPLAWIVLVAAVAVTIWALVLAKRRFGARRLTVFALLAAPALITPIWYELLRNHSQIHEPFTYVNLPAAVGVVTAAAVLVARPSAPAGAATHAATASRPSSLRTRLARTVAMTGEPPPVRAGVPD